MKGKLVVVEGSNASGKRTQSKILVRRLRSLGYKVRGISFPRYESKIGKIIGKYLKGDFGKLENISPYFSSMLYAFDRLAVKDKIDDWLSEGFIVVTDRYAESNMAFQAAKLKSEKERKEFIDYINEVEYKIGKIPKPNLVFYLDVPLVFTKKLHDKKGARSYIGKKRDIHESNFKFLIEVEKIYLRLASKNRWKKISCINKGKLLSKEEISDRILDKVKKHL